MEKTFITVFAEEVFKNLDYSKLSQFFKNQTPEKKAEEILTNDELVSRLGICKKTAFNWRRNGTISYSKIGKKIYYKWSDVIKSIDKHTYVAYHLKSKTFDDKTLKKYLIILNV
jgi:hypothetical protein